MEVPLYIPVSANLQNRLCSSYIILRAKHVVPDGAAHHEPPHLDLCYLQTQFFHFWHIRVKCYIPSLNLVKFINILTNGKQYRP